MAVYPLGVVGPWQIVIIALVILLLFGGKKIPELMKGLGKGVKSFKEGINEVEDQINGADTPSKPGQGRAQGAGGLNVADGGKEREMSFWDHLEELRGTLFRSIIALCIFAVLGFIFKKQLFWLIFLPASPEFFIYRILGWSFSLDMINVEMAAQFFVHLQAAFGAALILAFPYLIWEIWRFIAPALYEKEKKAVGGAFLMATGFFYLGVVVGYILVLPACVQFFMNYSVSSQVTNAITIGSYMSMFTSTVLLVGLAFEFPTVIWALSRLGILDRKQLRGGRRYALVAVLVLAALVTPADPLSMLIVAAPLYLMYEISILMCPRSNGID